MRDSREQNGVRVHAASAAFSSAFIAIVAALMSFPVAAAESRRPSNAEILFRLANPCPSTGETHGACTGYVVDRIVPPICGGAEAPENMQWQTLAEAREKDRWEAIGCRRGRKFVLPGESKSVIESFPLGDAPAGVEAQPLPATPR